MRNVDLRFVLPIILAILIGIIVSFAVQGKDKYSKIYIVDIEITEVLCKLEKMN